MYKLFIGFKKLGEFGSIMEAKHADESGLSGTFNLIGDSYRDSWYVSEQQAKSIKEDENDSRKSGIIKEDTGCYLQLKGILLLSR